MATLAESTVGAASRGEATELAVLVGGVGDPLKTGVLADGGAHGIDKDDLEVLVGGILVDPVRVENTEVAALATNTLLSEGTEVADGLELVDTVVLGLAVHDTLGGLALAATAADSNAVDNDALLGLVAEAVGLLRAGRANQLLDLLLVAVLPGANAEQEAHHIALLLAPELLSVLVRAHLA